jgi:acyl carrier protein
MTAQKAKEIILDIIAVVSPDADLGDVKSDEPLRDQLDMDSMDFLDIVMELRKRFKIEVPKEDYGELASLDSCVSYLLPRFSAIGAEVAAGNPRTEVHAD